MSVQQPWFSVISATLAAKPEDGSKTFYVVLHGAFALVEGKDKLKAHMIEMGSDHYYAAGSWLSESHVEPGLKVELVFPDGLSNGTATLDGKTNPLVKVSDWPNESNPVFRAIFALPVPDAIYTFNRASVALQGDTSILVEPPESITETHVLEYKLTRNAFDQIQLMAGDFVYWACRRATAWPGSAGGFVASLHLFNVPMAAEVSAEHNQSEFVKSVQALGNRELTIDTGQQSEQLPQPPLPPGLSPQELLSLTERQSLGDALARFLRTASFEEGGAHGGGCRGCCAAANGTLEPPTE